MTQMAGRNSTSTIANKKHLTKEEKAVRFEVEETMKGNELSSRPPSRLTKDQKKIWKWLFVNLSPSKLLSQLDSESLIQASIIIDRLQHLDDAINRNQDSIFDKEINALRKDYFSQYLRICQELCLSPQARAKMGTLALNAHKAKEDELMSVLGGDPE